ncbi:hypothetical protein EYF80_036932 [Liparis tanakae]|uniref:Uncharacterized protein n=1 Tax=Liparis tanakae TaxID=230148 RepID=A0A4Z2GJB8_9TELE|nr:hypothetical protein EYF80_036932 [Liparis tanakae]
MLVVTISSNHLHCVWLYRSTQRIRSSPGGHREVKGGDSRAPVEEASRPPSGCSSEHGAN